MLTAKVLCALAAALHAVLCPCEFYMQRVACTKDCSSASIAAAVVGGSSKIRAEVSCCNQERAPLK